MLVKPKLKYSKEQKADCTSVCPTCTKPNVGRSFYLFDACFVPQDEQNGKCAKLLFPQSVHFLKS